MIEVVNVGTEEVCVQGIRSGGVQESVVIAPGAAVLFVRVRVPGEWLVKREGTRVEIRG